jgi:hypothetical protein
MSQKLKKKITKKNHNPRFALREGTLLSITS